VSTQLRLQDYPTTPLYNIKAVVQTTGISPSTLRAWERRYQMCTPQRSESGYRLYSERDIAVIRWLKAQVDAGMAISQAVAWYEKLLEEAGNDDAVLPAPSPGAAVLETPTTPRPVQRADVRDFTSLRSELLHALIGYEEEDAESVISEAFALYSVEEVGESVIVPVLIEVGERWHRGELNVTTEHFASNYLLQRLTTLLRAIPNRNGGPLIWVGCAPNELHEIGAILVALYLRRAGYRVHYLGQNVSGDDLSEEVRRHSPAVLLFSASTQETAHNLGDLIARLALLSPRPIIGYGGRIFNKRQELRSRTPGVFMGPTALHAVAHVQELFGEHASRENNAQPVPNAYRAPPLS
jgi:MerR family transcriptional regulator, light-induced transcriptional regulator